MQRIVHLDFNFLMRKKSLYRGLLKEFADMGYNAILWEIEDKVQWKCMPHCVHPDAFTRDELKEHVAFARSLGFEIIPLLQTMGHAEYVLRGEKFAHLRELPDRVDCYCVSKPEVRELLSAWIEEYLELFGDVKDFHLGGDEAYCFGKCPVCAEAVAGKGHLGFAMDHLSVLAGLLQQKGIRPNIWADMVLQHREEVSANLERLRKFRIWDWHYSRVRDEEFGSLDILNEFGLDAVPCSAVSAWGDCLWCPLPHRAENAAATARQAVKRGLSGYCTTSWTVRMLDYGVQKPFFALAPAAECYPEKDTQSLLTEILEPVFSSETAGPDYLKMVSSAAQAFPLSTVHSLGVGLNGKFHESVPAGWLAERLQKPEENLSAEQYGQVSAALKAAEALLDTFPAGSELYRSWKTAIAFAFRIAVLSRAVSEGDAAGLEQALKDVLADREMTSGRFEKCSERDYWSTLTGAVRDYLTGLRDRK